VQRGGLPLPGVPPVKTLVIGAGQVGGALNDICKVAHETHLRDVAPLELSGVEVLQICFPDSENFASYVKSYIHQYKPRLTIINSSVAVGTTDLCGDHVVYSPVRGRHPALSEEMKAYPKFVHGRDFGDVQLAIDYFAACGLSVVFDRNPRAGEFNKLISNVHMGLEVAWRQEVERMLEHFKIDPSIYQTWERSYSEGYEKLNQYHMIRPLMSPKPIGGHCILPCTEILAMQFDSDALDFILSSNAAAQIEHETLAR
jgi:hypothetical protein